MRRGVGVSDYRRTRSGAARGRGGGNPPGHDFPELVITHQKGTNMMAVTQGHDGRIPPTCSTPRCSRPARWAEQWRQRSGKVSRFVLCDRHEERHIELVTRLKGRGFLSDVIVVSEPMRAA